MIEYENLYKLNKPFYNKYVKSFRETLDSGWFVLGANVKRFESNFASYCNTKHCIGVANGLDALHIALRVIDVRGKKEVIVPSNTYIATILAILQAGFKPILVEPDINTYNIDPDKIEENITNSTAAILVVHLYGKCCDMEKIIPISQKYGLQIIEDCAQSHGANINGIKSGSFGALSAFSFYPTKNLGALGDAGSLNTNNDEYAEKIHKLRNYGSNIKYQNDLLGYNSRLDEIQAAFLNIKLQSLDKINNHKRKLAKIYLQEIKGDYIKPQVHTDFFDVYHIFNIRHTKRDKVKKFLLENGVSTEVHYPIPPNKQKAMTGILDHFNFPISEEIHNTTLSLPISYFHTEDDIYKVVELLNTF